jgi:site-specific DNA recombinase
MTIPRAAFYERVSNDELTERNTIRNQDIVLHKSFDQHFGPDALEPWVFLGTFADDGVSGTIPIDQRPDGTRLMAMIRRGEVDYVCVTRGDRLTRDRGGAEAIAEEFWGRDIVIQAVYEHIDLTTPAGRLQFALMCAFAHYERELIRERTMNGRARVAGEGKFINGPIPFGYDVAGQVLVPSMHKIDGLGCTEAEFVEQMYERVAAGESARALWNWLMRSGVPSVHRYYDKRAQRHRVKLHAQWKYPRVREILRSTTYYGKRVLNYSRPGAGRLKKAPIEPVVQSVPPLVTRDLWNRVEQAMQGHTSNFHRDDDDGFVYLLSGKLVCGYCGFKLGGNYLKRKNGRAYLYYACTLKSPALMNARRLGRSCPEAPRVNGFAFEERVLQMIDDVVAHPEQIIDALAAEQRAQYGAVDSQTQRMRGVQQRVAKLQRGRAELLRTLRQGDITADEFREQSAATTADLADAQRELAALEAESNVVRTLEEQLAEARQVIDLLAEEWPKARAERDRVALRAMVQPLVQKIVVRKDEYEYTVLFHRSSDSSQSCDCLSITQTISLVLAA